MPSKWPEYTIRQHACGWLCKYYYTNFPYKCTTNKQLNDVREADTNLHTAAVNKPKRYLIQIQIWKIDSANIQIDADVRQC